MQKDDVGEGVRVIMFLVIVILITQLMYIINKEDEYKEIYDYPIEQNKHVVGKVGVLWKDQVIE